MRGARVYWKRKRERKREFSRRVSREGGRAKKNSGGRTPRVESCRALRVMCAAAAARARLRRLLRDRGVQPHVGVARAQDDGGAASAESGGEAARARQRGVESGHVRRDLARRR